MEAKDLSFLLTEQTAILDELKRRKETNRIREFFPDKGPQWVDGLEAEYPLRRELYKKHTHFFALGADERERCFMAGNRVGKCITINSLVDTDQGPVSMGELFENGKEFNVWAWDGTTKVLARASAPFRKPGMHQCYRLTMSDGRWIDVADDHRVLTSYGWRYVSELLHEFDVSRLQTILEYGQSIHVEDGQHLSERSSGSIDHYSQDHHRYDGQPLEALNIGLWPLQLQGDALEHTFVLSHVDDQGNKYTNIDQPSVGRLSSLDEGCHCVALSSVSSSQTVCTNARLLCDSFQAGQQPVSGLASQLQSNDEECLHIHDIRHAWRLLEVDDCHIVSCNSIGRHVVYDFEVEIFHNYIAAGIVHHNTIVGAYELTCHLTGEYPDWWVGRRYDHAIDAWAVGETSETTRDIVQYELLGVGGEDEGGSLGTGMIPLRCIIGKPTARMGIRGAKDTVTVRHSSGGISKCGFKSYDQGRSKFQGTSKHVIWLDEEPPMPVYSECLLRTMTTNGIIIATFTPLEGLSDVALKYLPELAPDFNDA